jgi:UDP-N-acetylmuramoylalanine--D-glutamate ligase
VKINSDEISNCTVMGFGLTGRAVVSFLLARGGTPFVSDHAFLSESGRAFLKSHKVDYEEGGHSEDNLLASNAIVLSPGIDPNLPVLEKARKIGVHVLSELDLAYLSYPTVPIIAVTGTNGKGTTVKLIERLLQTSGAKPIIAGNIGIPAVSIVDQIHPNHVIVLEISSFQLEQSIHFHPNIAILLNLTPDHLDRHKTMAGYRMAKGRLFQNLTEEDTAVLPSDLADDYPHIKARRIFFNRCSLPSLFTSEEIAPHNRLNLKAALAACSAFSSTFTPATLQKEDLRDVFSLPFCLQSMGSINDRKIINDSKSTNAASTLAALRSFSEPMVLILGGRHKHSGYDRLAEAIHMYPVRRTVLYGEAQSFLETALRHAGYSQYVSCPNLEEAIARALQASHPGDLLLFSPACSSYDQYDNYIQRGAAFCKLIRSQPSFIPQQ